MKGPKKNRRSQSSRHVLRVLLTILPLVVTLSLAFFPEAGDFSLWLLLVVFVFGVAIGTLTHTYWLRVLLKEREFYTKFYKENVLKPNKFDKELNLKHTKISLPFYLFGVMVFIIVVFVFGIFKIEPTYLFPLVMGALDGVPLSYYLMEKGVFS